MAIEVVELKVDVKAKTIRDIYRELRTALEAEKLVDEAEENAYFSVSPLVPEGAFDSPFPTGYVFVACYAVTGTTDGHYVHVDLLYPGPASDTHPLRSHTMFVGKTFKGMEHARRMANKCADVLKA